MKKQKIALVLGLLIAGCSSDQHEQSEGVAQQGLTVPMVYANGQLATGWLRYNSNVSSTLSSTAVLYNGERTYAATFKPGGWLGLYSKTPVIGYDAIDFYANARTNTQSPGLYIEVLLSSNPGDWSTWVANYDPIAQYCDGGSLPSNTWVHCRVPLSIFGLGSSTPIYGFAVEENSGVTWKTMAFTRFEFVKTSQQGMGGATSTGGSTSVAGGSSVIGGSTSSGGSTTTTTSTVAGGETSIGGSSANGGVSSIGGSSSLGGTMSSGGSTTVSGGTSSIGGSSTSVGGTTSEGGSVSLGGTSSAGGLSEIGGTSSIGGTTSIGGSSAEGGSVSVGGTSSIGGSSTTGGGTSLGCSVTGQQTGEFHLSVKDGAGVDRDFLVIVPASYVLGIPRSVLFGFHGAGGTYDTPRYYGFLEVPDAAADTIYIFPQGVPYQYYGVGWNDACDGYDMVFFDNMLAKIESLYCIDTKRVYAVGFSWGCDFVTGLACCRGDKIRGIGAASCSDDFSRSGDFTSYLYLPCPAVNHAGIRFTFDPNGDGGYNADQMAMTSQLYRYLNRCSENSSAISTECVSYQGCAEPFVDCRYPGLGHRWPSNWAQDTWNFFKQLP